MNKVETLGSVIDGLSARGGRPALVAFGEEGVETLSYRELAGRVRFLARGLRGVGVERGDHVAIVCGPRSTRSRRCVTSDAWLKGSAAGIHPLIEQSPSASKCRGSSASRIRERKGAIAACAASTGS